MIANFKRVKGLTKELSVVTDALKGSSLLSVDEEGSRVRRTTPLPTYDTTDICRRTVVAEHLPDKPTIGECWGWRLWVQSCNACTTCALGTPWQSKLGRLFVGVWQPLRVVLSLAAAPALTSHLMSLLLRPVQSLSPSCLRSMARWPWCASAAAAARASCPPG